MAAEIDPVVVEAFAGLTAEEFAALVWLIESEDEA